MPLLIGLVVFLAVAIGLERRRHAPDPARRIAQLVEPRAAKPHAEEEPAGSVLRRRVVASEGFFTRLPGWEGFGVLLERAGLARSPVEVAWLLVALVLGWALIGALIGGVLLAIVLALAAAGGARLWLGFLASRRRRTFDAQLPDVLAEIASALRAGHGFLQAMQGVSADAPAPIGTELQRVLAEARLGRPMDDALLAAGERVKSEDFDFVLDAVVVQRQVGGSLAGIFQIVGDSVRQRQQFTLKLRALTATGRLSAGVLVALPVLIAIALTLLNHTYMKPLVETAPGRTILGVGVVLMVIGCAWLNRVVAAVEG